MEKHKNQTSCIPGSGCDPEKSHIEATFQDVSIVCELLDLPAPPEIPQVCEVLPNMPPSAVLPDVPLCVDVYPSVKESGSSRPSMTWKPREIDGVSDCSNGVYDLDLVLPCVSDQTLISESSSLHISKKLVSTGTDCPNIEYRFNLQALPCKKIDIDVDVKNTGPGNAKLSVRKVEDETCNKKFEFTLNDPHDDIQFKTETVTVLRDIDISFECDEASGPYLHVEPEYEQITYVTGTIS